MFALPSNPIAMILIEDTKLNFWPTTRHNTLSMLSQRSDKEGRSFFLAEEAKGAPMEEVMDLIPINSLDIKSLDIVVAWQ